ncbi:MAG: DUF3253 domain-containing protein [Myxococcota bacterium]|nr:DUF3253 domain-containing protein [Myxococcota bacterium]
MSAPREKVCANCGRRFAWRKRWAASWDRVRYCSAACRGRRPGRADATLEAAILELLDTRAAGATICPSEAARRVGGEDWRGWMERTRRAARRLAAEGRVEVTQRGRVVDPSAARGPIRLRLVRS